MPGIKNGIPSQNNSLKIKRNYSQKTQNRASHQYIFVCFKLFLKGPVYLWVKSIELILRT